MTNPRSNTFKSGDQIEVSIHFYDPSDSNGILANQLTAELYVADSRGRKVPVLSSGIFIDPVNQDAEARIIFKCHPRKKTNFTVVLKGGSGKDKIVCVPVVVTP